MTITERWIAVYNDLLKKGIVYNATDFSAKTKAHGAGVSTSAITEILKGRTGVGGKVIRATIQAFPETAPYLTEGGEAPVTTIKSIAAQILELKDLLDHGIITKKEFEQGKKKILS